MAHTHPVVDSDSRFVINSTTREISTTSDKLELIQGDHQSERITFEIPKIVEGHDMSFSDRIEVHYINIDRRTNATSRDVYIIDDASVDGDKLTFSWLISGNATKYYGRLNFIILFECLDPDGNYTYKWNTEICKLLTIGEGISNASAVIEDHSDILEKFKKEILEEAGEKNIQPDWNQNDATQPDYVKNRPFYTGDQVETILVEESTVSFSGANGLYMAEFPSTFSATVGETYKVSWDGTTYESTCVTSDEGLAIGNLSILNIGSDTGEPFLFFVVNGTGIMIVTTDTSASHTFSISGSSVEVVKINEKYLPDNLAIKSDVEVAKATAETAQTTAETAQTTAETAQTTAENAQTTADSNKEMISNMFTSVVAFTFDKQTSGRDTFKFNGFNYYKISDFNPAREDVTSFKGTRENGIEFSKITIGSNCVKYGLFIVVASAGYCSLPITETNTGVFNAPSAGLYAQYEENNAVVTAGTGQFTLMSIDGLTIKSSTYGSTKKFRITVDDDYNVSATNTSDSVSKALATTEYVDNSVSNPLNITSAAVGQIAKITAVDDSGKPTAWEAVDMPSGESGKVKVWEEFMRFTVDNNETTVFDFSSNGAETLESKKVKEVYIYSPNCVSGLVSTADASGTVTVNGRVRVSGLNSFSRATLGSLKLWLCAKVDSLDLWYFGRDSDAGLCGGVLNVTLPIVNESNGLLSTKVNSKNSYIRIHTYKNGIPMPAGPVDYIKTVTVSLPMPSAAGVEFIVYVR